MNENESGNVCGANGDQWQPIETAPKGDDEILLARGERVTSGAWCGFARMGDSSVTSYGWSTFDGIGFSDDEPPTHWQPLPSGPK